MTPPKPVVLCILDGWGLSPLTEGNAVAQADTPTFDWMMANCPSASLITYGPDVGLPEGQMGNSEVGHMNIGAGRVVEMDLRRIDSAIEHGEFASQPGIQRFITKMKASGGTAHLMGVLSDGGVHSHVAHMIATVVALTDQGIPVAIHAFTDGRDVAPKSAQTYLEQLQKSLPSGASIATVSGRYYTMDRDNRWERVELGYRALVNAMGTQSIAPALAIESAYNNGLTDEFILPSVIVGYKGMADGDGIMCLNFRADRAREILSAIADPDFAGFDTGKRPKFAIVSGFAEYSTRHNTYMDCIFPDQDIINPLGAWVAKQGRKQFRIAETEKYPHVTFFFNGGIEEPSRGEDRYLAPSPKVATYDMQPEMSASEVTEHLLGAINSRAYDLIIVNYANPDMVGHTGDLEAAKTACATVDQGLGHVISALNAVGGAMIVTADHGNCETMIDPVTGGPHTAHTTNPVPVALINGPKGAKLRGNGRLADLAPTLLVLMELELPPEMTGTSLIEA
ncbi:MAG: 2,3-bisphosphoglycerate-independent phosphoglycerate mutase [Rhodobacteraceae bacterium]|nr:2,3-bisphosphoglycerate-independent phosphoglycerate mutase [Paracoccaceae bacterium]